MGAWMSMIDNFLAGASGAFAEVASQTLWAAMRKEAFDVFLW